MAQAKSVPAVAFGASTPYSVQPFSYSIAEGDFNGDGSLDVAVSVTNNDNPSGGWVAVQLNTGNGTLGPAVNYDCGVNPIGVVVGDFNLDGSLDLAVGSSSGTAVLLGNGDGTFRSAVFYGGASSSPMVADLNGDGKPDLVVTTTGGISVLLGNGDGTFQQPVFCATGTLPDAIAVADYNGDGKIDVAVANWTDNNVSVLLGNGDGTLQSPINQKVGVHPDSLVAADFNGDGKTNLAVVNANGKGTGTGTVSILQGNGDGTFKLAGSLTVGAGAASVAAADFNRDGVPDLVVSNTSGSPGTLSLFLGLGNGNFQSPLKLTLDVDMEALAAGDLNGDGYPDVAAVGLQALDVLLNVPTSVVSLSPSSLTFGVQLAGTVSASQHVTLTNTGDSNLTLDSVAVGTSFLETSTCANILAPLASCVISVAFKPTGEGTETGLLTVTDNAPGSPQTISLSGTGTFIGLAPFSLNFGDVKVGQTSAPQTATVTNVSTHAVSVQSVRTSKPAYQETNTCGSSLAAKSSCTVTVTFSPQTTGTQTGLLAVYDNGGGSPQTVSLTGVGD